MAVKDLKYQILIIARIKVFLVRFGEIKEQIGICEKSLEEHKEKMESLVHGLTFSSQFLSQSQLEKIKKQVASISRTYDELSDRLKSLLNERSGFYPSMSRCEVLVDIKLLIMGTKSPLLLEEYAALDNKINKLTLTTIGLKTSEEESLEVLIKKQIMI